MRDKILKYVLQNAVFYGGKADIKPVLGKVMSSEPELRDKSAQAVIEIQKVIQEVNLMSRERQKELLERDYPELLYRQEKKEGGLPELREAVEGKVVTRFAPAPTGPLNISHLLRAVMLSYIYAKKYKGRFILRFEDTDATRIKKVYYRMIKEDLDMAGIKPGSVTNSSDYMPKYYKAALKLINSGKAYMCNCPADAFRKLKLIKIPCPCRDHPRKENLGKWSKAKRGVFDEGEIVLRFKTSMTDPNPAMRDPPVMRILKEKHPLVGKRFWVWPLYNFGNVVTDHEQEISHVFRGKEHEHNTEIQRRIYQALGWDPPETVNFGMIYLQGEKLHTRDLVERVESGESRWDDPDLHTVRALVRRGFTPEAFYGYAEHCSLTKTDIRLDWNIFESYNRKAVDSRADRYMVVIDPVNIDISKTGLGGKKISVRIHPERLATREIRVSGNINVSKSDFMSFRGKNVRLKELANGVLGRKFKPSGESAKVNLKLQKIQWVSEPNIKVKIITPDGERSGVGESSMSRLKVGDIIQMERIGFGRVDQKGRSGMVVFFSHK